MYQTAEARSGLINRFRESLTPLNQLFELFLSKVPLSTVSSWMFEGL